MTTDARHRFDKLSGKRLEGIEDSSGIRWLRRKEAVRPLDSRTGTGVLL